MLTLDGATAPPSRSAAGRAVSFVKPYLLGLAGSVYLFTVGWTRWRHRAKIVEFGHHFGYRHEARVEPEIPTVTVKALVPVDQLLDVREIDAVDGNVSERELITICRLVRYLQPKNLFEFGTFDGRTTVNLAANAAPDAKVYTLDLPPSNVATSVSPIHRHEIQYADKPQSGARIRGSDVEKQIVKLAGDSGNFDYSQYKGTIDFVFIDASHTFEYVINDSLEGLRMLSPNGGTIVWHDYGRWDGVTAAIHELRKRHDAFREIVHIDGTTLAIATVAL